MVKSEDSISDGFYVNHKDVEKIASGMVPEETVSMMAETFRILGDPTRLRVVQALSKGELCVRDMAVMLGVGRTAISNHLRLLRGMRLVKYRREGKLAYYSLADDHIAGLVAECLDHVQKL